MASTPLRDSDYARLFIFALLLIPINVAAIVPVVLLSYSVISAKDNRDFSRIESAVRYCRVYFWLIVAAVIATQIFLFIEGEELMMLFFPVPIVIGLIYTVALKKLFLEPLALHSEWVEEKGIIRRRKPLTAPPDGLRTSESLASSSTDELVKLAQLKKDGHITAFEFEQIKKKLLSPN